MIKTCERRWKEHLERMPGSRLAIKSGREVYTYGSVGRDGSRILEGETGIIFPMPRLLRL